MTNRWSIGGKARLPSGNVTQAIGDGRVAGIGAGGEIVEPVSSADGNCLAIAFRSSVLKAASSTESKAFFTSGRLNFIRISIIAVKDSHFDF